MFQALEVGIYANASMCCLNVTFGLTLALEIRPIRTFEAAQMDAF